ncbi:exodeoxyribonuclease VII large subunit [Salinarimonas ramus]|uniref:Exodeoxyribonuclease 7 large subunit n=1 Tax=Salinarimonas ramus TaxID=690164 RepID=A0A917QG70_9HYPH|nr:exodeoxyribonuclease VII large subunit [Salinarimonas ramus]GGK49193.1 exodeoxyribonuclease 7 large subunit [Salinarimonas ramus]
MAAPAQSSNAPEWSVSELSSALKRTIEDAYGYVRLRGEISGFRGPHSSGHCYFSLKDESAKIDAVVWKGTYARLKTKPQEGLEVIATGKITTFPGKSSYQIVIDQIAPAGVGALMALLEERKRALAAQGLFAAERKRPLPYLPRVIGVVTSPTGAVIRDILHRVQDRFPRHVLVWPARVQGDTCAEEVAAGVRGFNALDPAGPIPRPDVIIVARGGGSIEDLWGFNDEDLVRAVAQSDIPVVSAVGHETDWTLIDLAADVRAPTPTGAAEMVVPVRSELLAIVHDRARRHEDAMLRRLERLRADLRSAARALPRPEDLTATQRQRLDLAAARLAPALAANARAFEQRLAEAARRLERGSPRVRLSRARGRLDALAERPRRALDSVLHRRRDRLEGLAARLAAGRGRLVELERARIAHGTKQVGACGDRLRKLALAGVHERQRRLASLWQLAESLSYRSVLARGYALVRDAEDRPVRAAGAVSAGAALSIEFADGIVAARAEGGRAAPPQETSSGETASGEAPASAEPRPRPRKRTPKPAPEPSTATTTASRAAPDPARPKQGSLFDL